MIEDNNFFRFAAVRDEKYLAAKEHLERFLEAHGLKLEGQRIYQNSQEIGLIDDAQIFAKTDRLKELCRRYNPPNYNPKHNQCPEIA